MYIAKYRFLADLSAVLGKYRHAGQDCQTLTFGVCLLYTSGVCGGGWWWEGNGAEVQIVCLDQCIE